MLKLETAPSAALEKALETELRAFAPLNGARLQLLAGDCTVPSAESHPERHFLAPEFVAS